MNYAHLLQAAQEWATQAQRDHWLSASSIKMLTDLEQRSPASLFAGQVERPLVAAFFGGTGVGKSTLLNRLAGQPVARAGVERPTSREISLYLHESISRLELPADCPVAHVRRATHQNDARRHVLWVDMPDIDSVEQGNRDLVLAWLPYVDVVMYVVSPDRYRDDQGWQLLRAHGNQHAWLFVINQWDRGHEVQYQDFQRLLIRAGFSDPLILRTDCRDVEESRKADDFERVQLLLDELTERHVLSQLESRADNLRLEGLSQCLRGLLENLGDAEGYSGLERFFARNWESTQRDISEGLEWPLRNVAREFVGREVSPLKKRLKWLPAPAAETTVVKSASAVMLWDDWADHQFREVMEQLTVEAGQRGLAASPLRNALDEIVGGVERTVLEEAQKSLRLALIRPGNAPQRLLMALTGFLSLALPLAALVWVSFQVVEGYQQSIRHETAWLGTDFAIHSGVLIGLAWLLPFFLNRILTPSAERSAIRGLRGGIRQALGKVENQVLDTLSHLEHQRRDLLQSGQGILARINSGKTVETREESALIGRTLPTKHLDKQNT